MTRGFYNYPTQTPIPCACGSHDAYWHRPKIGESYYECDACWRLNPANPRKGEPDDE